MNNVVGTISAICIAVLMGAVTKYECPEEIRVPDIIESENHMAQKPRNTNSRNR